MTLPWSAQQVEWLQAMGLEVLARPTPAGGRDDGTGPMSALAFDIPPGLHRAAGGVDLRPLLESHGLPHDVASRRAFWRLLRPLRRDTRR
ncbi:hypothetical protein [Lysobacter xanthus]